MADHASGGSAASLADLRAVPLFAELDDDQLGRLAGAIRKQSAPSGRSLCREGERGAEMFVIVRGSVTLHKRSGSAEIELGQLASGAYFGEMALIGDAPRSATVRAATDVEFLTIDRDLLMRAISAVPAVALQILKGYNARLADTTERLAHLTARQAAAPPLTLPANADDRYARALQEQVQFGPAPLAVLARRLQVETAWGRTVALALDLVEFVIKYCTCLLVADYFRSAAPSRTRELDRAVIAAFRRPTLGLLTDLSARLARAAGESHELAFVPEIQAVYFDPAGGRTASGRAIQALTAYRNRVKHGAEGGRDDEAFRHAFESDGARIGGERTGGIKSLVATILDAVGFLREYPLIQITSMTYEHGMFQYGTERVTGAYASLDRGTFAYHEPLENRRLYLLSRRDERTLRLSPFLRRSRCPTCSVTGVFLLFNASVERERSVQPAGDDETPASPNSAPRKERLEYLSYTCGHTLVQNLSGDQSRRGEGLAHLPSTSRDAVG